MNQIYRKSPFWSLAGPLIGYLAIQAAVQAAAQILIELPYAVRAYADIMRDSGGAAVSIQEIWAAYARSMQPALEKVVQYQVEITALSALGTIVMTGILFARDRRLERRAGVQIPEKAPVSKYWTVVVFGAAGCIAATCLTAMAQFVFYDSGYQQSAQNTYSVPFPVQVVCLGIMIPLAEELMFRGVLYKRMRERQGFWYPAVWSALLFSFMHTNTTQMIYTFLLGILLAYLYEKFGSVKAPVLLHILLNAGSVIFTEAGVFRWLAGAPARMAGAVIAGAFLCSVMFVLIQRMPGSIKTPDKKDDFPKTDMYL